jgi:hypothetical protein
VEKEVRTRSGIWKFVAAAGVLAVLVPSVASAGGGTQRVRVVNRPNVNVANKPSVRLNDFQGQRVNSRAIANYGTFNAAGSSGAMDVWTLEGAFLGYMDNLAATPFPNAFTLPAAGGNAELHRLVVMESPSFPGGPGTMDCQISISTDAIQSGGAPVPLLEAVFTAPTVLESPLRLTDDFHITVTGSGGAANTNCAVGVVGIAPTSALVP